MAQPGTRLTVCNARDDLAAHAANMIVRITAAAIHSRGKAMLALCGGTTPQPAYALLAQSPRSEEIDWSRTFVFQTDERFVPADDPRSNFGMLQRTLLAPRGVDTEHVFPIPTRLATASDAALAYEATLGNVFGIDRRDHPPRFDLIVLGLGEDGHTASLFPGAAALDVRDRWVVASPPGSLPPPVERITLTFPVLDAAREILFLVSGANKAAALRGALAERSDGELPAARVHPADGNVTWLVDRAASGE